MATKKAKKVDRNTLEILLPLIIVALFGIFLLTGALGIFEGKLKDTFTGLVPEPPIDPKVVIVDVDDKAIQNVGMWPWSRDIHADILMQLKELGAKYLTYDIEFVDRGPVGVTSRERDQTIKSKGSEMGDVFGALAANQLKPAEAKDYAQTILNEGIMLTARDNDELLGRALKVFGKAFATLNYDLDEGDSNKPESDARKAIQFESSGNFPFKQRSQPRVERLALRGVELSELSTHAAEERVRLGQP